MNNILTTMTVLGVIVTFVTNQPASATVTQSTAPTYDHAQIILTRGGGGEHRSGEVGNRRNDFGSHNGDVGLHNRGYDNGVGGGWVGGDDGGPEVIYAPNDSSNSN